MTDQVDDLELYLVDNSTAVYQRCPACRAICRRPHVSTELCCVCYWAGDCQRRISNVKTCTQCANALFDSVSSEIHLRTTLDLALPYPSENTQHHTRFRWKFCGHSFCMLELSVCCACSDKRPRHEGFQVYVDGQGLVKGSRSAGYCSDCRDHWKPKVCGHDVCALESTTCCECSDVSTALYCAHCRAVDDHNSQYQIWLSTPKKANACGHNFCDLSLSICCACADTRPLNVTYGAYLDGAGWVGCDDRRAAYCPGCRCHRTISSLVLQSSCDVDDLDWLGSWVDIG